MHFRDELLFELGPLSNDWSLGLASAAILDATSVDRLRMHVAGDGDGRSSDIFEGPEWIDTIWQTLVSAVEMANSSYFRFDLAGVIGLEEPRFVTLRQGATSGEEGLGLLPSDSRRKITALVCLEVSGPSRTIVNRLSGRAVELAPGDIVMTPSYCPIAMGDVRDSGVFVAFHAFGPAFR